MPTTLTNLPLESTSGKCTQCGRRMSSARGAYHVFTMVQSDRVAMSLPASFCGPKCADAWWSIPTGVFQQVRGPDAVSRKKALDAEFNDRDGFLQGTPDDQRNDVNLHVSVIHSGEGVSAVIEQHVFPTPKHLNDWWNS